MGLFFFKCLIFCCIFNLFVACGVDWKAETPIDTPTSTQAGSIRVVTFNVYNRPWRREERAKAALETLKNMNADVISFQEISTGWLLPGNPLKFWEKGLGIKYSALYWHETNYGVFKTGLGLLSRFPILNSKYVEFSNHQFWDKKGYMVAQILSPEGSIHIVNAHLSSGASQSMLSSQWRQLENEIDQLQTTAPVMVMGDFNTKPSNPIIDQFLRITNAKLIYESLHKDWTQLQSWSADDTAHCSQATGGDSSLLDYIFAVGAKNEQCLDSATRSSSRLPCQLKFERGEIVTPSTEVSPSDHCPVQADIKFDNSS